MTTKTSTTHVRQLASLAAFVLLALAGCAQQHPPQQYLADSATFVATKWQTDTLDGFILKRHHFRHSQLFNANQYFCIIEIPKNSSAHLTFVADTQCATVNQFALQHDALAAINGSYFDMAQGFPICYLRIDGHQWGENTPSRQDTLNRKYYQYATIRLLQNGRPRFLVPDSNRHFEELLQDNDIMTAGPMLIRKGIAQPQRSDRTFAANRHNRTAIGLKQDGSIVLFVADGRFKNDAAGLTLPELARVMGWLGCVDAVNLDGGGSSTMFVKGFGQDGTVNHPSDNARFDREGLRRVSNAILVTSAAKRAESNPSEPCERTLAPHE